MTFRVAIIGAGPSGLAQLRAFEAARQAGYKDLPEIVCYEKQNDLGGMWNYTWRTGLDKNGEPVHGSMYRYLWSNGPKECLEFADYSFDEHFGRPIPSYPPRAVLKDYIMGRIEKDNLRSLIRFECAARWITWDEDTQQFSVTVTNHQTGEQETSEFDYVVVATGHFSTPNVPYFDGVEKFPGRVLHAHDFRDAREFEGQDVLLIGSSYSAEDIGSQCFKYGARSVTLSHRSKPLGFDWPEGMEERPLLERLDDDEAVFSDGTRKRIDALILCTGYLYAFPFLPEELQLKTGNCLYPDQLYKGIVFDDNPRLLYLGMQDQYFTFNMFDAQAWFARDVMLGRIALPDAAARRQHMDSWLARHGALDGANDDIDFQADYIRDLMDATDYPDFPVEKQGALFKQWLDDKRHDIMGFRNRSYCSTMTGTQAPCLPRPWLEIMDDSLQSFLKLEFTPAQEEPARKTSNA